MARTVGFTIQDSVRGSNGSETEEQGEQAKDGKSSHEVLLYKDAYTRSTLS